MLRFSEEVVMDVIQAFWAHNMGWIIFSGALLLVIGGMILRNYLLERENEEVYRLTGKIPNRHNKAEIRAALLARAETEDEKIEAREGSIAEHLKGIAADKEAIVEHRQTKARSIDLSRRRRFQTATT